MADRGEDRDIAIVAMACHYPEADSPEDLWDLVLHQRRAFRALPASRFDADYWAPPGTPDPDRTYLSRAGLLAGWSFERRAFNVSEALFQATDLTHWLALSTAETLLAQISGLDSLRDRAGVVLGNSLTGEMSRAHGLRLRWPYVRRSLRPALARLGFDLGEADWAQLEESFKRPFAEPGDDSLAGALSNTIAGRLCNTFDFHGTGYTVDGACSSSLLAMAHGRAALLAGDLDLVVVGGVDVSLDPLELVGFARLGALAQDEMRIYDTHPTGFLPGEGCGLVAMMRLADARRSGRPVLAVLAACGTSSDGAGGLTRPASAGHAMAAIRAYRNAQLDPATLGLLEGHGTGTAVGDPTEIRALGEVVGHPDKPVTLGSVKANIGHTKAAAGIAGVIKAVMALGSGILPPTTGCPEPHPLLQMSDALTVRTEAAAWPAGSARVAGVSSMGFGGINVHAVLLAGDAAAQPPRITTSMRTGPTSVWLLTARDPDQLRAALAEAEADIARRSDAGAADLAWHLTERANLMLPVRCGFTAESTPEARRKLAAAAAWWAAPAADALTVGDEVFHGRGAGARVGLLFPGQAAPVVGPGIPLEAMVPQSELATAAVAGLHRDRSGELADATEDAQPAIIATSLLALGWLEALGVRAVGVLGHSLGEIAALCWAGALRPHQAVELAEHRGALMRRYGVAGTGMASVGASADMVAELLLSVGAADRESPVIAASNAVWQTAVSGPLDTLRQVGELARRRGVGFAMLPVSHGFHSPAMAPVAEPLAQVLDGIELTPAARRYVSSVVGGWVQPTPSATRALLVDQLTAPVRFTAALAELAAGCDLLIEAGPGRILTGLAKNAAPAVAMNVGPDQRGIAETVAAVAAAGAAETVVPWLQHRRHRPAEVDRDRVLLANPCQSSVFDGSPSPIAALPPVAGSSLAAVEPASQVGGRVPSTDPDSVAEPDPDPDGADCFDVLTEHLAAFLGLDRTAMTPATSLSRDLHMNSLQVVQVVSQVVQALGRVQPAEPLSLADACLADVADFVAGLGPCTAAPVLSSGTPWTRAFTDQWVDCPEGSEPLPVRGRVLGWRDQPSVDLIGPGSARLVTMVRLDVPASELSTRDIERLHAQLRDLALDPPDSVVVLHRGGGAAVARSLRHELSGDVEIVAVEVPAAAPVTAVLGRSGVHHTLPEQVVHPRAGFEDLRLVGTRLQTHLERAVRGVYPSARGNTLPVGAGDVVLVTGGVAGITAECAAALAERSGASLRFVGRSAPDHPAVAEGLVRLRSLGVEASYAAADILDADRLPAALMQLAGRGHVAGLIHGAGINRPCPMPQTTAEGWCATYAPKVTGLARLLAAMDGDIGANLSLLVTFGSVIGRMGLDGQSEYCFANEALRTATLQIADRRPEMLVRHIEWGLWSGVGMGVGLGVVDALRRRGIDAIDPEVGRAAFLAVLGDDQPTVSLIIGRHPPSPCLRFVEPPERALRFHEQTLVRTADVELVAEAELSSITDGYLADHVLDGSVVLPAVVSLEAISQTGVNTTGESGRLLTEIRFPSPVLVDDGRRTIRLTALRDAANTAVEVALTDDSDAFGAVRASAVWHPSGEQPPSEKRLGLGPLPSPVAISDLYGSLFFHRGRFRLASAQLGVSANQLVATLNAPDPGRWFSAFLPPELELGDLARLDATIHVLQMCYPHRRLLPVGAGSLVVHTTRPGGGTVLARQQAAGADTVTFDVDLVADDGQLVLAWRGLVLRVVGQLSVPDRRDLFAPWLARHVRVLAADQAFDAVVSPAVTSAVDAARWLSDHEAEHMPSGRLRLHHGAAATSVDGQHRLTVTTTGSRTGVDWSTCLPARTDDLMAALPGAYRAVTKHWCDVLGETDGPTHLGWTILEAVKKTGLADARFVPSAPLTGPDVVATSGRIGVVGGLARLEGQQIAYAAITVPERSAP